MATMEVASLGMDMRLLTTATIPDAMSRPSSAMPMGSPMATTEPKAMTRMMTAASRPRASLSGSSNSSNATPPYATVGTAARSSAVASLMESPISTIESRSPRAELTWMNAMVRSLFTWLANSYGPCTLTPGSAERFLTAPERAVLTAGSSMPAPVFTTTWEVMPPSPGLTLASMSWAMLASLSGWLNSVRKSLPMAPLATVMRTATGNQMPSTMNLR